MIRTNVSVDKANSIFKQFELIRQSLKGLARFQSP